MSKDESVLIKEFKEKDLQRVRNLANKKFGDKTVQQVGYRKEDSTYKEGVEWIENGKTWTIKDGLKQTITKLDNLKKIVQLPLMCPKCSKPMKKGNLDKQMFFLHKMCFDCLIEYETELKRDGKYEEYEKNIIKNNATNYLDDIEKDFAEFLMLDMNQSFITEQGDIENWKGNNNDKESLKQRFKEYINNIKDNIGL